MKRLLIIAGSDCSGGAGIQADIKTATAFGVYAMTAVSAVTVQDTQHVLAIQPLAARIVRAQVEACLADIGADAIKIGMLGSAATIKAVAAALKGVKVPIVLDPVMVSTSGADLLAEDAVPALIQHLFPLATLVTPNLPEARRLADLHQDSPKALEMAGRRLLGLGPQAVLIKGGHGSGTTVEDVLVWPGGVEVYGSPRQQTRHTHGTGCTLSSAIACGLAEGLSIPLAVGRARDYVQSAIAHAPGFGHGHGPLNHLAPKTL